MTYLNFLLFGVFPYIAVSILLLGSVIRYEREQYTWKASSSQLLEKKQLRRGSIPFHIGILGIFIGHFVGLLTPNAVWHALGISPGFKQIIAIVAGGIFGLICLYGLVILLHRRLTHPAVRATSTVMDILILMLLLGQLLLGLGSTFISVAHLDGSEMLKLMSWAQNIVIINPQMAVSAIADAHWIFKMHVTLGLFIFAVFPFSRLVHMISVPVKYLFRNYQVVRTRGS
ncbi:respiratory nitrate reductase subunit gamma [Methylophaga sp. OBS4]|uniref:respiratory nitrate reductase subunit gamma n=1 Tax=Methylophaga sp. OBS4 TaxID=2991935 RepID=UPI002250206D|nr:respiratory nitrate reductase subunit gamma [Methylophaga sp. OBS4]MCX4188526.1 respiratory nitrate reductase subunit gamma [Methylophaga sp. OBS4]